MRATYLVKQILGLKGVVVSEVLCLRARDCGNTQADPSQAFMSEVQVFNCDPATTPKQSIPAGDTWTWESVRPGSPVQRDD